MMEKQLFIFSAGAVVGGGVVLYGAFRVLTTPTVSRFVGEVAGEKLASWLMDGPTSRQPRRVPYHQYSARRPETTEVG